MWKFHMQAETEQTRTFEELMQELTAVQKRQQRQIDTLINENSALLAKALIKENSALHANAPSEVSQEVEQPSAFASAVDSYVESGRKGQLVQLTGDTQDALLSQLEVDAQPEKTSNDIIEVPAEPRCDPNSSFQASSMFLKAKNRTKKDFGLNIEPKHLDLQKICSAKFPGKRWPSLSLREQAQLIRGALEPAHFMIDPYCSYMKYWDVVIASSLVFTAVFTPYEVVFTEPDFGTLFVINAVINVIFIKDMIMQFFLKVPISGMNQQGTECMLRDPAAVRWRYLKSWFLIDFLSVLPFDIVATSMSMNESASSDSSDWFKRLHILRCLRGFRMFKLLGVLKTSRMIQRWQTFFTNVKTEQRMAKFALILLVLAHWMACLWGLTGLMLGASLCKNGKPIDFSKRGFPVERASWITTLFTGGKVTPDNPCYSLHLWAASMHWSVMTITSIGYGDISPIRFEEYIVGIILQIASGVLWAWVLASLCSLLSNVHPVEQHLATKMTLLNVMLCDADVPKDLHSRFREYLCEAKACDAREMFQQVAGQFSPLLRGELMLHLCRNWIATVPYFKEAPTGFVVEMIQRVNPCFFSREPCDGVRHCLCVVDRGIVAARGRILTRGRVFQEDFVISNRALQRDDTAVSLGYTQILVLSSDSLEQILENYPMMAHMVRTYALAIAFCRVVIKCAQKNKHDANMGKPAIGLAEAFAQLKVDEPYLFDSGAAPSLGPPVPPLIENHVGAQ